MKTQRLANVMERATVRSRVVCRDCGRNAEIDCAIDDAACLSVADQHGFVILETEVVHRGRCPDCASGSSVLSGPGRRGAR